MDAAKHVFVYHGIFQENDGDTCEFDIRCGVELWVLLDELVAAASACLSPRAAFVFMRSSKYLIFPPHIFGRTGFSLSPAVVLHARQI